MPWCDVVVNSSLYLVGGGRVALPCVLRSRAKSVVWCVPGVEKRKKGEIQNVGI